MRAAGLLLSLAVLGMAMVRPQPSLGFTGSLSRAQITAAVRSGVTLVRQGRGYQAPGYLLFAERNTLGIRNGDSPVEAILVGTPYERLRYASYLAAFQGQSIGRLWADGLAHRNENVLQFIVFTHSNTSRDRNFLERISKGRLQLGRYVLTPSKAPEIFGPALDYYQVDGSGRQFRWLGSVTFRFDLSRLQGDRGLEDASGTFSFTDSGGTTRRYHVDLAHYR